MKWTPTSIDDCFEFVRNGVTIQQNGNFGIPITRIETIAKQTIDSNKVGYANILDIDKYKEWLLQDGDILMSHINSTSHLGKCAIYTGLPKHLIHGMNLLCLRPRTEILYPKYAMYYFKSVEFKTKIPRITKNSVNQSSFTTTNLKQLQIPLPPLSEQKRIAAVLDKSDQLRQKRKEAIEKLDRLVQSVFLDMFGDPVTNPKGWEVKRLEEVCSKITDGTHHSPPLVDNGIPYITAKHIKPNRIEFNSDPTFISEMHHREIYSRCNPERGDILYIKDGATTGIAAINDYNTEFSMLSSLALLKPDYHFINSEYLCSWLNNNKVKSMMLNNISGAAITRLTLAKIKASNIMVPDIETQSKYSQFINSITSNIGIIQNSMIKTDNLFNSLLQRAFRGELKFNDKAFRDL